LNPEIITDPGCRNKKKRGAFAPRFFLCCIGMNGLPTVATATTVAAAIAAAATTITAAVTAAAATIAAAVATATAIAAAVTAAAAAIAAAVATATATAIFTWFSFLNYDGTAIKFCFIQGVDSALRFIVVVHLNKTKAFRAARHFVESDGAGRNLPELFEGRPEAIFAGVIVQFCYENVHCEK
jgi:hypothetical protein